MVSNIKFNSYKHAELFNRMNFNVLVAVVLVFALLALDPPRVLLLIALVYAASGPVQHFWRRARKRRRRALQ
jgi:CDP-diacylglycerol--serine O-phosphatidyltransferase